MDSGAVYLVLLLIGLVAAAPTTEEGDGVVTIDERAFNDSLAIYSSEHDIVQLVVPLNGLNTEDALIDSSEEDVEKITIFFVEADIKENGERENKGLYILEGKTPKKLLENGVAVTADDSKSKDAFFGATDGLYIYDVIDGDAEKYGSITDSIIDLVKINNTDTLYILTADHTVYKVTEQGTKKDKIDSIVNAQQLVLDSANNLYFLGEDKKPYVLINDVVKGFEVFDSLPEPATYVKLVKPPFLLENGVVFIHNDIVLIIYANGSVERTKFEFKTKKPTAYGLEAGIISFIGNNKKIYEYNIYAMFAEDKIKLDTFHAIKQSDSLKSFTSRLLHSPEKST